MKNRKIGVGFIGLGWVSLLHYQGIKACNDLRLVGVTDKNRRILTQTSKKWKVKAYNSIGNLLKDPEIDAVYILTPTAFHFRHATASLKTGKHVLIEKPVSFLSSEITRLNALANKKGLVCFPGHNFVYRPAIRKAKEIIRKGTLGKISYACFSSIHLVPEKALTGWRKDLKYSGGGALIDSGFHLVYQLLYLLGRPREVLAATSKFRYNKIEGEDMAILTLKYNNGMLSNIIQSWTTKDRSPSPEIKILGEKGTLWISDALYLNGRIIDKDVNYKSSFNHLGCAFAQSILKDKPPVSTMEDALLSLKIVKSAYRSAKTHHIQPFINGYG